MLTNAADSFLGSVISAGPFYEHKQKTFFRICVRFYVILTEWLHLMASLVEICFDTFLAVCELKDEFYV